MNLHLGHKSLFAHFSKLFILMTKAPGPDINSYWKCMTPLTSELDNPLYDVWLSSRSLLDGNTDRRSVPGASRPFTVRNIQAACKILTLCAWDLTSRLFALQPTRIILLIFFELLRGLFPAARGYSHALLLNEAQTMISSGHHTWPRLVSYICTEACRMALEGLIDSFASSNENIVHSSARFYVEHKQLEQRLKMDVPTLADPVIKDLLYESDMFVQSFGAMSAFGLFSPFEMIRIMTIMAELASHVMVIYSWTFTSSSTALFVLSVLASSVPLLLTWSRRPPTYFADESDPYQVKMAEEQEKMRRMVYDDSYRPEVILFGLSPWILRSWSQARTVLLGIERKRKMENSASESVMFAHVDFHSLASACQNIPLALLLRTSSTSLGSITMFSNSVQGVFYTTGALLRTIQSVFQSVFLMGAFHAAMNIRPHLHPQIGKELRYHRLPGGMKIEAKSLSFTYPGSNEPALKNLSFTLEAGETLAVVGYNGSGKSTLAHILLRILEFDQGELLINGIDIRLLSPTELHARISAVFQGFSKFNASAQENIGFGYFQELQDATAIECAARLAGADVLLGSLPRGMKTTLGISGHDIGVYHILDARSASKTTDGYHNLSGGEWQRIALSRAFLKAQHNEIDLLLLDEPTSSLDAHAQNHVFDTVETISRTSNGERKKTVIFITHRLSTARRADKIAMMANGTFAEFGTHKELLQKNGLYAALYKASI